MPKKSPVDPLESAEYALHGIIVTMAKESAIVKGTIYIKAAA